MRVLWLVLLCLPSAAQSRPDPQLLSEINRIKAIDNHAHPVRFTAPGEPKDQDFDALPVDSMEPYSEPVRTRPQFSEAAMARLALFQNASAQAKAQILAREANHYPEWVLDKLGIDVMLANRVSMGPSIRPPRFLWVPYVDALLFPLDNRALAARNPDVKAFQADEDRLLKHFLSEVRLALVPRTLSEYLRQVVTPTLERMKNGGAVAVKFEAAYLRPLDFGNPPEAEAAHVYAAYLNASPPYAEYKLLQDFLFHYIAAESGRLRMAVHFHTGVGAGGYFNVSGSNPMLLEPVLNDPSLRTTNFVFLHGGFPFSREVTGLLTKPNAYADFSFQSFFRYPRAVSETLRAWCCTRTRRNYIT